jgi:hypothetical protein
VHGFAQSEYLLVLGGQPGDGQLLERGELGDLGILSPEPGALPFELLLEPGDLRFARIRDLAGLAQQREAPFELLGQVLIRAGPLSLRVEPGARDPGLGGKGLQRAGCKPLSDSSLRLAQAC